MLRYMSRAHRAEVTARATGAPRVRLRFARTTLHPCTCPRSAGLRARAVRWVCPCSFVVDLLRLAETALAHIVYTPHPVPARAVMRVPAPSVPVQCLLPLFSPARPPAAMLVRMFASVTLVAVVNIASYLVIDVSTHRAAVLCCSCSLPASLPHSSLSSINRHIRCYRASIVTLLVTCIHAHTLRCPACIWSPAPLHATCILFGVIKLPELVGPEPTRELR